MRRLALHALQIVVIALALLVPAFGGDPHSPSVYWMSLGFTFIGAAIFSIIKGKKARVPQEAIIGISYAVASAAVIVAMSQSTGESEHLKDMLVGNILSVSWNEVLKTAAICCIQTKSARGSPSAGSWASSRPCSGCTFPSSGTCRPGRRSSARLAWR